MREKKKKLKREFEGDELLFKVLRKRCRALNHQKHVSFFFFFYGRPKQRNNNNNRKKKKEHSFSFIQW